MFYLNRFSFLFLFGIILYSLVGYSGPVFAQETDDEYLDFDYAGGLVITAGRTSEPNMEVPGFVTVISAEEIASAASITELLEGVPGVRFLGALSGPGSESISMRGFGENSFGRVLVLVNGNKINDPDMKA
ncbi:MAG: TonB-dependent receptor plug domain-containing protein, partial [Treponema sp.]|nr:TonB-dependent receptor plug domain-containing protein [Treponema sp.]